MIEHLLNRTATLLRRSTPLSDGQGGWVDSTTSSTIRVRIAPASGSDLTIAARREAEVSHACYYDSATQLIIGDQLVADGISYDVVIPDLNPSIRDHHHKALLKERQTAE